MAKGARGGKRSLGTVSSSSGATTASINATQSSNVNQPSDTDVLQGNVQAGDTSFEEFVKMTDDEKADVILKAMNEDTPDFLEDSVLQRFVYSTGMNEKPTLVDDATLDSMQGVELFRTVNSVYDSYNDVGYSAKEICDQLQQGDFTMYNSNGGKAYGAGLYFATDYNHSVKAYGRYNNSKTQTMRAKIKSTAKVITLSKADRNAQKEISSGSKLGQALKQVGRRDSDSVASMWALAKGYDVLDCETYSGYHTVINRGALAMSSTTKSPQRSGRWK